MTRITVRLTLKELELLTALASDQLFRREFIDPKMPGYKANAGDLSLGRIVVERLRSLSPGHVKRSANGRTAANAV